MLIENKTTGKRFNVSDKEWEGMQKSTQPGSEDPQTGKGKPFSHLFKVINSQSDAEKAAMVPPELRKNSASNEDIQADAARKREAPKN